VFQFVPFFSSGESACRLLVSSTPSLLSIVCNFLFGSLCVCIWEGSSNSIVHKAVHPKCAQVENDSSSHNSMEQCLFYSGLPCSVPRRWWLRVVVFSSCKRPRQLHSRKGSRKVVHVRIPTGIVVGQRSFLLLLLLLLLVLLQVAMQRGSIQA
jgi:hypothetical protein